MVEMVKIIEAAILQGMPELLKDDCESFQAGIYLLSNKSEM